MTIFRAFLVALFLPGGAMAQSPDKQTLADIRQELEVVYVMVQQLKRELSTTQSPGILNAGSSFQERIDAIEFALQRLTARTEELENRVERVVADGTMRVGDLEFRLVELEGGDLAALGETSTLGGSLDLGNDTTPTGEFPGPEGELAVGEQDDFDRALTAFEDGDYSAAVARFQAFNETYPAGPLSGAAHLYRGQALEALGESANAARAYLEAFSVNPSGPEAPASLLKLGLSLHELGQTDQACVTLGEISIRFPGDAMISKANNAMSRLGCS